VDKQPPHYKAFLVSRNNNVPLHIAKTQPGVLLYSCTGKVPQSFAKSCSIWILLLPLVGLLFILPSVISCKSPSCLKTWPIHRCFLCRIEFSICLSLFTLLRTYSRVTLSSQMIFSILLHIRHFKGFFEMYKSEEKYFHWSSVMDQEWEQTNIL